MDQVMNMHKQHDDDWLTYPQRRAEQTRIYPDKHHIKSWAERAMLVYAQYVGNILHQVGRAYFRNSGKHNTHELHMHCED